MTQLIFGILQLLLRLHLLCFSIISLPPDGFGNCRLLGLRYETYMERISKSQNFARTAIQAGLLTSEILENWKSITDRAILTKLHSLRIVRGLMADRGRTLKILFSLNFHLYSFEDESLVILIAHNISSYTQDDIVFFQSV